MPIVSVTRLRIRRWWYLPPFLVASLRSARQAARADGNLGAALLRDANRTYWTTTSWASEDAMKAFMHAAPHGAAMRKLLDWCDEAALTHWTQDDGTLPAWETAHSRLAREGRPSKVRHPTPSHTAHRITPPSPRAVTTRLK
jgi:hypothetical protein